MTQLKSEDIYRETLSCPYCGKLLEMVSYETKTTTADLNKANLVSDTTETITYQ